MKNEPKQIIVVRKDLKMSPGKMAAQVAHASVTAVMQIQDMYDDLRVISMLEDWVKNSQTKIVVSVNSEEELLEIYDKIVDNTNIAVSIIRDEGRTELGTPTLTTVGIGPELPDIINPLTQHLPLYR